MREPFSHDERQRLLATRAAVLRRYDDAMNCITDCAVGSETESAAIAAAEIHMEAAVQAENQYFDRLPRTVMSCCPFDGKPLVRTFDPYGLDGLWWRSDATPVEVPSCPHFCMLRGAPTFSRPAQAPFDFQENAGSQAAYVIPRILDMPGMVAVLSRLRMASGGDVTLAAYFAERRPPVQSLAANWPRSVFLYTTALGQHRWRFDDEARDFDLVPWLAKGKIRWCEPGSDNEHLSTDPPDRCPYVHRPR